MRNDRKLGRREKGGPPVPASSLMNYSLVISSSQLLFLPIDRVGNRVEEILWIFWEPLANTDPDNRSPESFEAMFRRLSSGRHNVQSYKMKNVYFTLEIFTSKLLVLFFLSLSFSFDASVEKIKIISKRKFYQIFLNIAF